MKLLLLALISFAMQVTATPTCDICSKGLKVVGGTGCYCGTGKKKTGLVAAIAQTFVAATKYCDTTLDAVSGTAMIKPGCASTDGSTATTVACSCGTVPVDVAKDQFCYAGGKKEGIMTTTAIIACADTTGATKNPSTADGGKTCYCGSAATTVAAGSFCSIKKDKTGLSSTTLRCTSTDGGTATTVACTCGDGGVQAAATKYCYIKTATATITVGVVLDNKRCTGAAALGLTKTATKCSCGLNFPTASDQTSYCQITGDTGVISTTIFCAKTKGLTTGQGACKCGSDKVDVSDTTFCYVKAAGTGFELTKKRCTGAQALGRTFTNPVCSCTTTANTVTGSNTNYCRINGDSGLDLSTTIGCSSTDGSALHSPTGTCKCGTDGVSTTQTKFCFEKTNGQGVAFTYLKCTGTQVKGSAPVGTACNCGNALADTIAAKYCYVKANGVGTVLATAKAACTNTDGTVKGTACYCGTSGASTSATQYCDITSVTAGIALDKPRCTTNVATSKPAADCICGTTGVGAAANAGPTVTTAQFCFVQANGVGTMYSKAISAATTCDTTACTPSNNVAIVSACKCGADSTTNECAAAQYCWVGNTCNAKSNGANTAFHGLLAFAGAAFAASLIVV